MTWAIGDGWGRGAAAVGSRQTPMCLEGELRGLGGAAAVRRGAQTGSCIFLSSQGRDGMAAFRFRCAHVETSTPVLLCSGR